MSELETTRLSLHVVAELLLGGPQYEQSKTIHLRVTPGGFGTVAAPDVRVQGESVVVDGRAIPLSGRTVAEVAADAGLTARSLDDVYSGGSGLTEDHTLTVDAACAAELAEGFRVGDEALAEFAPDAQRVLWPEHFDVGITVDRVNYGVSPGDANIGVPYAYVGPWTTTDLTGPFWNASFGAARPLSEVGDLVGFFTEGKRLTDLAGQQP
jgi:hypothetical protein